MYQFIPINTLNKFIPEMIKEKVSEVARSKGQFIDQYRKYGKNLPEFWQNKRNNFIKRTLAAYKLKPSYRRKLALIAWAYMP